MVFTNETVKARFTCGNETDELIISMNSKVTASAACLIEIGSSIFFTTATHHQEDQVTLQPIIDLETFKFHDLNLVKLPAIESEKGSELEEIRNHL